MIQYLRIPKNKFWGWVISSIAFGMLLGALGAYALSRAASTQQIDELKQQLQTQASESASSTASLESELASREASLAALNDQYVALQQQQAQAATQESASSSSDSGSDLPLEVIARTVRPSEVATGDDITLTARVQGNPERVTMRIYNSALDYDETYTLKRTSRGETIDTWRRVAEAPTESGTYRYYATAYLGDKSATQPGASPGSFEVE
jgi:hypothetical protein